MRALRAHAEVDTVFLAQNRIGSPGAACVAEFIASSPRLRSLSLSDNDGITDEGVGHIISALPAASPSLATLS